MFEPSEIMKIFKRHKVKLASNCLWKNTISTMLIYSVLYLTASEIFADNSISVKNYSHDYIIMVTQSNIELNLNERSQRTKISDQNRFNFNDSAINSDRLYSQYTEYFITHVQSPVSFFYLTTSSNNSFRAPPIA
ncbi:MAG TPA: hypothetical protein PKE38_11130 [Ignavibacteriaceae bacterium]|nr:hypothetical protein [Ignavibacterium sp.]HMN25048.1 hypothetical protein [Ignavibacteriaceae bacterium]